METTIDALQLKFSPESLFTLNVILGFIMFGVALELQWSDFKRVWRYPRSSLVGLLAQFIALPALTYGLVWLIRPQPSMALGMMLVAACPGGNISNFISLLARGNAALSVSLTAISTLLAVILTPLNFTFWAGLYPPAANLLSEIYLSFPEMVKTVSLLLALPLVLGMYTRYKWPEVAQKITRPIRILSLVFFAGFVVIALRNNFSIFTEYLGYIFGLVLVHNLVALTSGYSLAALFRLEDADRRSLSIETGIQNSGLALILIFNFFGGLGGMAIVAAWWGIWHILAGLALAYFWSQKPFAQTA